MTIAAFNSLNFFDEYDDPYASDEGTEPKPRAQLEALIRKFDDEDEPYRSLVLSMWTSRYGTYDDLARIKEWSAAGGLGLPEW